MNCTTHHNACDCREAKFLEIESERDSLAEQVRVLREGLAFPNLVQPINPHLIAKDPNKGLACLLDFIEAWLQCGSSALQKADEIAGRK